MKDFENIGKRLPYVETPEYISGIINKGVEMAIKSDVRRKKNNVVRAISIVASGIAASIIVVLMFTSSPSVEFQKVNQSEPLNEVLSQLSDEQVMELTAYSVDDIPEY